LRNYDDLHKLWGRAHAAGSPVKFTRNAVVYKELNKLTPGLTLDAGCGTGEYSVFLSKKGHKVTAFDPSPFAVKTLFEKGGAEFGIEASTNTIGEFQSPEEFHNIVSIEVIEHVANDQAAVQKFSSLLREGGTMVITVPAMAFLYSEADRTSGHFRRYSRNGLKKLLVKAGFKKMSIKTYGFPLLFIYLLLHKLFLGKIIIRRFSAADSGGTGKGTFLPRLYSIVLAVDQINIPYLGIGYVAICKK
jgi:SAM-dependent methyltransferase